MDQISRLTLVRESAPRSADQEINELIKVAARRQACQNTSCLAAAPRSRCRSRTWLAALAGVIVLQSFALSATATVRLHQVGLQPVGEPVDQPLPAAEPRMLPVIDDAI